MSDNASSESESEKVCAVCNIATKQSCGRCKIVYYCGRDHQKLDWKSHSKDCNSVRIVNDPKFGRHYVATRDIEVNEIVFRDKKPLVAGPATAESPRCLNCYEPFRINNAKRCDHCGWPLCWKCTRHGPECELSVKYRGSKVKIDNYTEKHPLYEAIVVMRAIALRNRNPEEYKKYLSLEDHCTEATEVTNGVIQPPNEIAKFVKDFMKLDDLEETEVARIIGIFRINSFGVLTTWTDYHAAVFEKASYLTHECRPNSRTIISNDPDNEGNILVRAVRAIPKGNPITVTYTDPFYGTERRRQVLRKIKFFDCTCERCRDPTEFGTMFNAVKCIKRECTGYMLPSTFLVSTGETIPDYVCGKCEAKKSSEAIGIMMNALTLRLLHIGANNVTGLKKFIKEQSKTLHENHHHILNAEYKLAVGLGPQNFQSDGAFVSAEILKENIKRCEKISFLLENLAPGEIDSRGTILFNQYTNMLKLANVQATRDLSESRRLLEQSNDVLSEIYRLTRHDSKDQKTGQMAEWARLRMEKLNL